MSKLKFSDIAIITMGQSPKGESCNNENIGEPLLNGPTEFTDFYPKATQYTTNGKKYSKVGDILFCVRGSTTGRMNISDKEYVLGRGLASIRHKDDKKLNIFLKYLIETNLSNILKNTSGSTFPNLSSEILNSFEFSFPKDMNIEGINSLLKSIDSKIELNNKINKELETMAKTLYNYWFVQFDFPDENGKPYKSSGGKMVYSQELKREIPEGWEVDELKNLISIERGISYKSSDITDMGIPMVNLNSFYLDGTYKPEGIKYFNSAYNNNKIVKAGDLIIATTDVTRNADIIGKATLIPDIYNSDIILSCDIAKINCKDSLNKYFLEKLFNSDFYHNYIKGFASGTLVLHLNTNGIDWYKTFIPPNNLLIKFSNILAPIQRKKELITLENQELAKLRDWLLPMLMNGQVKVK